MANGDRLDLPTWLLKIAYAWLGLLLPVAVAFGVFIVNGRERLVMIEHAIKDLDTEIKNAVNDLNAKVADRYTGESADTDRREIKALITRVEDKTDGLKDDSNRRLELVNVELAVLQGQLVAYKPNLLPYTATLQLADLQQRILKIEAGLAEAIKSIRETMSSIRQDNTMDETAGITSVDKSKDESAESEP